MNATTQATEKPVAHDRRIERALTELFAVESRGGSIYLVHSESGETYAADLREQQCTCPDREAEAGWCKHLLRVAFETGGGIPGTCHDCAALRGDFPCADCFIGGPATLPE